MSKEQISGNAHASADNSQPVIYAYDGVSPEYLQQMQVEETIFMRNASDKLPNDALREVFATMSPEEADAYDERQLRLAKIYHGPGGP